MKSNKRQFRFLAQPDDDPMSSMANMVDIMLVFACGLLCALVTYLQLDTIMFQDLTLEEKRALVKRLSSMQEIENLEQMEERDVQSMTKDGDMEELGTVFFDPKTGKMLMIKN